MTRIFYLLLPLLCFVLQSCSSSEADTPSQDPADVEAAALPPEPDQKKQVIDLPHEPKGEAVEGLPYIAYRAIADETGKLGYCADYNANKQPVNAVVIQPENAWSGNLIFYENGKMNIMAYKDMRSPDKARFFFKDIGKNWKYGNKKINVNITLKESYSDVLTVTINELGSNKELEKLQYIHSEKLAKYTSGDCTVFAEDKAGSGK